MPLIPVDSLEDPRLEPFRQLKGTNRTHEMGMMVAESVRVVRRLVESECQTVSLLVSQRKVEKFSRWLPDGLPVYVIDHDQAEQLIGFDFHSGVLGCGIRPLPPLLDELVDTETSRQSLVVCPRVTDPENLGVIIRLAAAFGISGMLLGPGTADPFSRRALRVSMATALTMPLYFSEDIGEDLQQLRRRHAFQVVGTVASESAIPLPDARRPERMALMFGNEAHGLEPDLVGLCDEVWTIPLPGEIDSINVAVAAGIFLYAISRP